MCIQRGVVCSLGKYQTLFLEPNKELPIGIFNVACVIIRDVTRYSLLITISLVDLGIFGSQTSDENGIVSND